MEIQPLTKKRAIFNGIKGDEKTPCLLVEYRFDSMYDLIEFDASRMQARGTLYRNQILHVELVIGGVPWSYIKKGESVADGKGMLKLFSSPSTIYVELLKYNDIFLNIYYDRIDLYKNFGFLEDIKFPSILLGEYLTKNPNRELPKRYLSMLEKKVRTTISPVSCRYGKHKKSNVVVIYAGGVGITYQNPGYRKLITEESIFY